MQYFLDNCISPKFAPMLGALDVRIVALRDAIAHNTPDIELFEFLAGSDYVFVSQDRAQLTRIAEAHALRAAGISALYFGPFWSGLGFWKQAEYLVKHWQKFHAVLSGLAPGSIVEAKQNGKLMTMP